jgi:uncharacterized membrane protein
MGNTKFKIILGVALIVIGAAILSYGHFTYKSQEKILDIGPLQATAERTRNVNLPPIIGWVLIGSGAVVLLFGAMRPKD